MLAKPVLAWVEVIAIRLVGREADVSSLICDQEAKSVIIAVLGEARDLGPGNT